MSNLSLLVSLKLRKNQLTAVPPEVFSLECLSLLDLTGNAIRELPEDELGSATALQSLLLSGVCEYVTREVERVFSSSSFLSCRCCFRRFSHKGMCRGRVPNCVLIFCKVRGQVTKLVLRQSRCKACCFDRTVVVYAGGPWGGQIGFNFFFYLVVGPCFHFAFANLILLV